jgi:hypothetical protein
MPDKNVSQKTAKEIYHPIGENSPILVALYLRMTLNLVPPYVEINELDFWVILHDIQWLNIHLYIIQFL